MTVTVRIDDQTFSVEIQDINARPVIAIVDGQAFEVWPEETHEPQPHVVTPSFASNGRHAQPAAAIAPQLSAPPVPSVASKNGTGVYAPIPGVIQSLDVQPGDSVTPGQQLCVLEAMKMKNLIRATRAGTIATVNVSVGQQVRHHEVLMTYQE